MLVLKAFMKDKDIRELVLALNTENRIRIREVLARYHLKHLLYFLLGSSSERLYELLEIEKYVNVWAFFNVFDFLDREDVNSLKKAIYHGTHNEFLAGLQNRSTDQFWNKYGEAIHTVVEIFAHILPNRRE